MELNKEQIEAVNHLDGPCIVTASPGSGKTAVLVERVCSLIQKGIKSENILCITFTNKAAKEMKERVMKKLNVSKIDFFIGTFHSLCSCILRKFGHLINYPIFTILDDKDQADLISSIARKQGKEISKDQLYNIIYVMNKYRDNLEDYSYMEENLHNSHLTVIEEYLEHCVKMQMIDFSGLIFNTIELIENNDQVRNYYQEIFKYILVDETQDTNGSQFELVNLLGGKWKNIMILGDPDQSIYGWRGARYQNLRDFNNKNSNCKIIHLSKNYRSTPQIITAAVNLINKNTDRFSSHMETDNESGTRIICNNFFNPYDEGRYIFNKINELRKEGWDYKDITVLYRINRMSEPIEVSLRKNNIPYEVIGSYNFYDRKEVKDCICFLKFILNKKDGISFHRISKVVGEIGDVTVGKIDLYSSNNNVDILTSIDATIGDIKNKKTKDSLKLLQNVFRQDFDVKDPCASLRSVLKGLSYDKYLNNVSENNSEMIDRIDNVKQVLESTNMFKGEDEALNNYLQQISLMSSSDKENNEDKVTLMTLHSAKGLEFPIVFMVGVEEGCLPHYRSIQSKKLEEIEEERRLAYVGITRTKKILHISWCKSRGNNQYDIKPSRFLYESQILKRQSGNFKY